MKTFRGIIYISVWIFTIILILFMIFSPEFHEWLKKPYQVTNSTIVIICFFIIGRFIDKI